MTVVLVLMAVQGTLGAFDTLYYHEFRARLPRGGRRARAELRLHAARDFIYAALFMGLPWLRFHGAWAVGLGALILAEIAITMADFAVELRTRGPEGVVAGERITHGVMAILYGAMLANLTPVALGWATEPTALLAADSGRPGGLAWLLTAMGVGVAASGIRDLLASRGWPRSGPLSCAPEQRNIGTWDGTDSSLPS